MASRRQASARLARVLVMVRAVVMTPAEAFGLSICALMCHSSVPVAVLLNGMCGCGIDTLLAMHRGGS